MGTKYNPSVHVRFRVPVHSVNGVDQGVRWRPVIRVEVRIFTPSPVNGAPFLTRNACAFSLALGRGAQVLT